MNKIEEYKLLMESSLLAAPSSIIRDYCAFKLVKEPETITESSVNGQRKYTRLTGLVQKSDEPNENGRVYPHDVMVEAIEYLQPAIKARMVLGELDHPDDAKIHTENACLLLTKLWLEGKDVYAQFEILEGMPKGQMLKALIDQGVTVSISSRGVGDVETQLMEDGTQVNRVLPGFRFVCFDAVNEPSVKGTALNVMESKRRIAVAARNRLMEESKLISAMKAYLGS